MTFSLTVLGCSAAIPFKDRHLSAHLLNANERFLLIDCGEGTQWQLRKYHYSLHRIDRIFISHLHGDHFFGLIGLLNSMHLLGRKHELHVYGPVRLKEIIDLQLEVSCTTLQYPIYFHPVSSDSYQLIHEDGKISVHSFPLRHSIPTTGFVFREKNPPRRLSGARSYAYCSDTAFTEAIIPYISQVSLLYHETTFMSELASVAEEKLHSTTLDAARIAQKARVGQLMIGHFSARYEDPNVLLEEARGIFPDTIAAVEGEIIQCNPVIIN